MYRKLLAKSALLVVGLLCLVLILIFAGRLFSRPVLDPAPSGDWAPLAYGSPIAGLIVSGFEGG
jgi:hypothetical protein